MYKDKKLPNIHETVRADGSKAFVVCTWDEYANNYRAPLDKNEQLITGCTVEVSRSLNSFTKYTKKQAYSRATVLFRYARIAKRF